MLSMVVILISFLSTLSLRRATHPVGILITVIEISIHALLAESDLLKRCRPMKNRRFLSTLSLRRATWVLMGGLNFDGYFYPRSPCGERHMISVIFPISLSHFYPRSPCGERRWNSSSRLRRQYFYPRSPCGERLNQIPPRRFHYHFYPRSPCGERR